MDAQIAARLQGVRPWLGTVLQLAGAALMLALLLTSECGRALVLGAGRPALPPRLGDLAASRRPTRHPPRRLSAETSASLAGNLPLALLAVVTVRWAFLKLERQQRARLLAARQEARGWRREGGEAPPPSPWGVPPSASRPEAWRKFVRAPVVEEAWARFCGSIVQEVRCAHCLCRGRRSGCRSAGVVHVLPPPGP